MYGKNEKFTLKEKVDGKKLWQLHFGYAAQIEKKGSYDPVEGRKHARESILSFIEEGEGGGEGSY